MQARAAGGRALRPDPGRGRGVGIGNERDPSIFGSRARVRVRAFSLLSAQASRRMFTSLGVWVKAQGRADACGMFTEP